MTEYSANNIIQEIELDNRRGRGQWLCHTVLDISCFVLAYPIGIIIIDDDIVVVIIVVDVVVVVMWL